MGGRTRLGARPGPSCALRPCLVLLSPHGTNVTAQPCEREREGGSGTYARKRETTRRCRSSTNAQEADIGQRDDADELQKVEAVGPPVDRAVDPSRHLALHPTCAYVVRIRTLAVRVQAAYACARSCNTSVSEPIHERRTQERFHQRVIQLP